MEWQGTAKGYQEYFKSTANHQQSHQPQRTILKTLAIFALPTTTLFKGYKDGLQPESLADGNWLVKQNQPVSKIETKSLNLTQT